MRTLKKGMVGDDVKILQQFLGISVDGVFGVQTEAEVKKWQAANGLVADGIIGAKSWDKISKLQSIEKDIIYDPLKVHITKCPNRVIKYIAIHYTAGASSISGSAQKAKSIFENREASADFCVDEENIVQFNPDLNNYYCWAVGDKKNSTTKGGQLYLQATNKNTVSIEICSNLQKNTTGKYPNHSGWSFSSKAIYQAKKLVKILMKKYNIPIDRVVRHYDISGKLCPGVIGWNNGPLYNVFGKKNGEFNNSDKWLNFKNSLNEQ